MRRALAKQGKHFSDRDAVLIPSSSMYSRVFFNQPNRKEMFTQKPDLHKRPFEALFIIYAVQGGSNFCVCG